MLGRLGRRLQVANVPLILVKGAVDGEGAAIEQDDEDEPTQQGGLGSQGPARGQQGAEQEMGRHDGPFQGAQVEQVGERPGPEEALEESPDGVARGFPGHAMPSCRRAWTSPEGRRGSTRVSMAASRCGTLKSVSTHMPWGRPRGIT